jgi:hypothetical protein
MANSTGALRFKDGTIRYYEYNGVSDSITCQHYATKEEVAKNWRKYLDRKCVCGNEEPVNLFTPSGNGFYFNGKACKTCNSIKLNEYPIEITRRDKQEDWAKPLGLGF